MQKLKVKKIFSSATIPSRANDTDVGIDIYSNENKFIPVGETVVIGTGVCFQFDDNTVCKVEDRSSMAVKGLRTGAGVIDPSYSGEIKVVMHNFSAKSEYNDKLQKFGYNIYQGDKIAQVLFYDVHIPSISKVESFSAKGTRKSDGFGSSGR